MEENEATVPKKWGDRMGSSKISRGTIGEGEVKLFSWDAIPGCRGKDCEIFNRCEFQLPQTIEETKRKLRVEEGSLERIKPCLDGVNCKKPNPEYRKQKEIVDSLKAKVAKPPQCAVGKAYMRSLSQIIFRNFGDYLDETRLYEIGMHLSPLYAQLIKFKIYELSIDVPVKKGAKGLESNPIYKEIRSTLKMIDQFWGSIGLKDIARHNRIKMLPVNPTPKPKLPVGRGGRGGKQSSDLVMAQKGINKGEGENGND